VTATVEGGTRPIRVGFVVHVMQVAGAEVLVCETIARLGPRISPVVFCLDQIGPLGERLQQQGVPVVAFNRRPGVDWRLVPRMAREIRERGIDVVHAHQYTPFFYAAMAARISGRRPRVIFTEHGRHYPDVVSWKRRLGNRILFDRLADEVTAVCDFSAKSLADKDGFAARRITVIPNGIDIERYQAVPDRDDLRRRLGLASDRLYIILVARFHPVKDHATLLRGFAGVAAARPNVDLLLAGDGPLRPVLEAQIAALGITSRVRLLGVRSDVADLLRAADIFTLSSVSEAASITLLEAMASGLPAVVTAVGGNPELVRGGVDGVLVPRGDAAAFTAAFLDLIDHPGRRRQMGQSGADRVRDQFQMATTIERYGQLYAGR
jgi:glycosyltransferase involved in cell wall biosynthesis